MSGLFYFNRFMKLRTRIALAMLIVSLPLHAAGQEPVEAMEAEKKFTITTPSFLAVSFKTASGTLRG